MGTFSWLRADRNTLTANVYEGSKYKFLIPKAFGGGSIVDTYKGYGKMTHEGIEYDMYEILAAWNRPDKIRLAKGVGSKMPQISEHTTHNRGIGVDISAYDVHALLLRYPLKLVSPRYKGTYEDCNSPSLGDPDQGWCKHMRESKDSFFESLKDYEDITLEFERWDGTKELVTIEAYTSEGISYDILETMKLKKQLQWPCLFIRFPNGDGQTMAKAMIDMLHDYGQLKRAH